ncbi:MAG: iron-sulfur cluster assembly scaffold protein [Candidatus Pacearchaeota archaeon]
MKDHNDFPEIYREHILDLYRNPSGFGELKDFTNQHKSYNSICGDEIKVQIKVSKNMVEEAKFSGSGCVISIVSASLLMEKIKGMNIEDLKKLNKEDMFEILKVKVNPGRLKCMLLSLEALRNSVK